jgi:hypothetical protein
VDLLLARLLVEDLLRVRVERGERADRAQEDAHWMRVVLEAFHQLLDVLVQHRVEGDLLRPLLQLRFARQLAEDDQIRGLEVCGPLGELLDRVAAVFEDAFVAVDEGDAAATRRRIHECRIVGHQSAIVVGDFDLSQIGRADGAVGDGNLVGLASAVVSDRERIGHNKEARYESWLVSADGTGSRQCGRSLRPTAPGPRYDNARCRTAASGDLRDACGTGRRPEPRPSDPF